MTKTTLISSPSVEISLEWIGDFEIHIIGIGSKILRKMGYDGKMIDKRGQWILSPIIIAHRDKHECLGFDGRSENAMTIKTIFENSKDTIELDFSSR